MELIGPGRWAEAVLQGLQVGVRATWNVVSLAASGSKRKSSAPPPPVDCRLPGSYAWPMLQVLNVSTATPTEESGRMLAESAIRAGLCASGQIAGPVKSLYVHKDEFGQSEEWVLSLKTTVARYAELEAHLIENHEWQNPEVTAVALAYASSAYLEWVERVTAEKIPHDG